MLQFLDIFFVVFHSALIIFILFGWIFRPLRMAHLICVLLTGGSWFILGLFYGMGYCPLTEWHWQVLTAMDHQVVLPASYVQYILERLLAISISARTADVITFLGWLAALMISLSIHLCKYLRR